MADSSLLFCPFCSESYEGETRCPAHDIPLVTYLELQKHREVHVAEDELHPGFEPRFGRALLFACAASLVVGFFLPFLSFRKGSQTLSVTALQVASTVAMNLWTIPLVGAALVLILARRRTLRAMRSARLAVFAVSLVGMASLTLTRVRIGDGLQRVAATATRQELDLRFLSGFYVLAAALVLAAMAAFRFGVHKVAAPSYRIE